MKNYNKKYIYVTSDGTVRKKEVVKEESVSKKLSKLREQIVKYTKVYEMLADSNLEPEKQKEKINEWIESTIRYYEINYGDALDSIIAYYDFKLSDEEVSKNKSKVKRA